MQNTRVKRRTGPRPTPSSTPVATNRGSLGASTAVPAPESRNLQRKVSEQEDVRPKSRASQLDSQEKKPTAKPPRLKKEQSDIFKSFSKPREKVSRENTGTSTAASPVPNATVQEHSDSQRVQTDQKDDPMNGASESEQEEDFMINNTKPSKKAHPSRQEREEQLRNLMNDDDDDPPAEDPMEASETNPPDQMQESSTTNPPEEQVAEEAVVPPSTSGGGRRRGRRKVMKKKMLKDEEGYLVTKEEPAWESFSEDEPLPKETSTPASTAASSSAARSKRMSGKPGQGNIMSFFGKK
ncbi:MAG: hypothetical protein Q9222_000754 [Ikaeria aurantiellina]